MTEHLVSSQIVDYYRARDANLRYERDWGYSNPVAAAYYRMRDEVFLSRAASCLGLPDSRPAVLEVGSGYGHELVKFAQLGVPQTNLTGTDLMPGRVTRAEQLYPSVNWVQADSESLPFDDNQFDLTYQILMVSNGLTPDSQRNMAAEMLRVTRTGGTILWWDLVPTSWPVVRARLWRNPAGVVARTKGVFSIVTQLLSASRRHEAIAGVRRTGIHYLNPIPIQRIHDLFPGCHVEARHAGLDWELWESIWPYHPATAERLYRAASLAVHAVAVVRKA